MNHKRANNNKTHFNIQNKPTTLIVCLTDISVDKMTVPSQDTIEQTSSLNDDINNDDQSQPIPSHTTTTRRHLPKMTSHINEEEEEESKNIHYHYHIAYFITDHGFGHAARSCELIRKLFAVFDEVNHNTSNGDTRTRAIIPSSSSSLHVTIVTSVPQWFLSERLFGPSLTTNSNDDGSSSRSSKSLEQHRITFHNCKVDVGVLQELSSSELIVNVKSTIGELQQFWLHNDSIATKVAQLSKTLSDVNCIVYDITPLAPMVAQSLQIPCIAVSNFAWNWLYQDWLTQSNIVHYELSDQHVESLNDIIQFLSEAYSKTHMFIQLPYCALDIPGLSDGKRVKQVELNAWLSPEIYKSKKTRIIDNELISNNNGDDVDYDGAERRKRVLSSLFPDQFTNHHDCKFMLFSFGGGHELQSALIQEPSLLQQWNDSIPPDWRILINMQLSEQQHQKQKKQRQQESKVLMFSHQQLTDNHIGMIDVLQSVDVVCCKTGYGIVSEALSCCCFCSSKSDGHHHLSGVLYTDRPGFCENELLVAALKDSLGERCQYVHMRSDVLQMSPNLFYCANKVVEECAKSRTSPDSIAMLSMDGSSKAANVILQYVKEI